MNASEIINQTDVSLRFESVPEPIIKKVSGMRSHAKLDTLFEKAVIPQTLDEIDWDNV